MPLINVKVIEGVFDAEEKRRIVTRLTDAMVEIEGENMRPVTWGIVEEVLSGDWGIAGNPMPTEDVKALAAGAPAGPRFHSSSARSLDTRPMQRPTNISVENLGERSEMKPRPTYRLRRLAAAVVAALAVTALAAAPALAGKGGGLRIEPAWYDGEAVSFLQPTLFSANRNGGVLACFGLGPDLSGIDRPSQPLYVIFDDTATQDHCDGQPTALRHDHVLSVAPGDPAYSGAWTLVLLVEATPGSIDLAANPITSAEQIQSALADGSLVDVTSVLAPGGPVRMVAPVIAGR
jgi:4-oxalocrotonate tautomerase